MTSAFSRSATVRRPSRAAARYLDKQVIAWSVALAAMAAGTRTYGQLVYSAANNNYHAQVYNNWCGTASIEMMLDCPAVTGPNTILDGNLLAALDGPIVPANGPRPVATTAAGVVTGETINGVPAPAARRHSSTA